jgi:hypothetical protein
MKDSTRKIIAVLSAAIITAYFGFKALGDLSSGNFGSFLFTFTYAMGMSASLICLFTKPTEGKLYNTAIIVGGLPSLLFGFMGGWHMFEGTFNSTSIFQLAVGITGALVISRIIATGEEAKAALEENSVEVNE